MRFFARSFLAAIAVCLSFGASAEPGSIAKKVLAGARAQVAKHVRYAGSGYYVIPYPGGDIDADIGVCTDLITRAFRNAGIDLQKRLHEDRVKHPEAYPTKLWQKKEADSNIDHRRCQNLVVFFRRFAKTLPDSYEGENLKTWRGGDVVFFQYPNAAHPWHVAIVSDKRTPAGVPYIVHLYPEYAAEKPIDKFLPEGYEDLLRVKGHFRWPEKKRVEKKTAKPRNGGEAKTAK